MDLDEDGVLLPRLRLRDVLLRGALFGLGGIVVLAVAAALIGRHHDRMEFLAVAGGTCLVFGGGLLLFGLFFWAVCAGDIRRCRDWRTLTGQHSAPTVVAPVSVRLGVLGLVAAPAAFGLYQLVDRAPYGSWLHSG
ncbi:DUF6336 family protein [Streptomyces sp. Tue6028]|uniref:DUF6336 family protein n=1 Tax=Streptomyces sp. Tue6028 TaxID=2036037 RepID=UPI003D713EE8